MNPATSMMVRVRGRRGAVVTLGVLVVVLFMLRGRNAVTPGETMQIAMSAVTPRGQDAERPTPPRDEVFQDIYVPRNICRIAQPLTGNLQSVTRLKTTPPTWSNFSDVTDRLSSTFYVIDKKESYEVCDRIEVRIVAKNARGEQKKYGGDYFRARIVRNDMEGHITSAMSDGEVFDHGDGTYTATFTLRWVGESVVRVYLVHTSEAVAVLRSRRDSPGLRYSYKGRYCEADGSMTLDEKECNVYISSKYQHICKYTDRRSRNSWYCLHPTLPGLNCSNWCRHRSDSRSAAAFLMTSLTDTDKKLFNPSSAMSSMLHSPSYNVQVTPGSKEKTKPLPPCQPRFRADVATISGHYADDVWTSSYCNVLRFSVASLATTAACLRGKTIHFLGDSLVRQLFDHVVKRLRPTMEITADTTFMNAHGGPTIARDVVHNIDMVYRSHGYPLGDDASFEVKNVQYIANYLDDLRGVDDNSAIAISVWKYFTPHNLTFYEKRILGILGAVKRLHARSPNTPVVFLSPNTRELDSVETTIFASDLLAKDLNAVLRKTLSKYPRIGFLDAWDMTNAQLYPNRIHPIGAHIDNLSDHFLSYICPFG